MSSELKVYAGLNFSKGGAKISRALSAIIDVTGDSFVHGVQQIGNTEEEVAQISELGNAGYVLLYNMEASTGADIYIGFADVSAADDARPVIIPPGEIALFRLNYAEQPAMYARTSTGTANLEYIITED